MDEGRDRPSSRPPPAPQPSPCPAPRPFPAIDPMTDSPSPARPSSAAPADTDPVLEKITGGDLWIVDSRRRNGLILHKSYYVEFAGPGAVVGSTFDENCRAAIPLGNLSLVQPQSIEEREKAYRIRLQWLRLTNRFTAKPSPTQRAQTVLDQFEQYFEAGEIERLPDEVLAMMVGVLPHTMRRVRSYVRV